MKNSALIRYLLTTFPPDLTHNSVETCDANLLNGFLENRLIPAELDLLEEHLAECAYCREMLVILHEDRLSEATTAPSRLAASGASARQFTMLMWLKNTVRTPRWIGTMAAIFVLVTGILLYNQQPPPEPVVEEQHSGRGFSAIPTELREEPAEDTNLPEILMDEASPEETPTKPVLAETKRNDVTTPQPETILPSPLPEPIAEDLPDEPAETSSETDEKNIPAGIAPEKTIDDYLLRDQPLAEVDQVPDEGYSKVTPYSTESSGGASMLSDLQRSAPAPPPLTHSFAGTVAPRQTVSAVAPPTANGMVLSAPALIHQFQTLQKNMEFVDWKFPYMLPPAERNQPNMDARLALTALGNQFKTYLKHHPQDLDTRLYAISLFGELRQWESIIDLCEVVTTQNIHITSALAIALYELDRLEQAEQRFHQLENQAGMNADTYFNLAVYAEKRHWHHQARQYWQDYLASQPPETWAMVAQERLEALRQ